MQNITLICYGNFEKDFLSVISNKITQEFSLPVKIKEGNIEIGEYYNFSLRQYNGNDLLKVVDGMVFPESLKIIGLFNIDLYIPILTYIFGQAYLGGRSGISSCFRLSNDRYGMKQNESLLLERFCKEIIHELGHTFGLIHCHTPKCVMLSSTYVEDIDQKSYHLCHTCRAMVKV